MALNKRFGDTLGDLDYSLQMEIIDDHPMRVSRVHWDEFWSYFKRGIQSNCFYSSTQDQGRRWDGLVEQGNR